MQFQVEPKGELCERWKSFGRSNSVQADGRPKAPEHTVNQIKLGILKGKK